jgi:hypothetical protein
VNKLEENQDHKAWVNLFPILTVIACVFSFFSPLFSLYTVIWVTDPLPTFAIIRYSITLFGDTSGNLEALAGLYGQAESIGLLKLPGIVIGIILLIILLLLVISFTLDLVDKAEINKIKKYWGLLGGLIIILVIILIGVWSFLGQYLLQSMNATDAFWGDAATIGLGIVLPIIGGVLSIIGYLVLKIPEIKALRGEKKNNER